MCRDVSLYWGTWYTIATCSNCTNPANVCSQLAYEPIDSTNTYTNLTYIGSYQDSNPDGEIAQAFGNMSPLNLDTFNPLYKLDLDLGFAIIPSNFWILTTAGDGDDISAIVTMSCVTPDNTDQQLFFLSRKPYLVPPVTFDSLVANVKRAITNYDQFDIVSVTQQQGWCDYALTEDFSESNTCDCGDEDDDDSSKVILGFAVLAGVVSTISLIYLIYFTCTKRSVNVDKANLV
jgi:hypothetical protein